MRHSRIGRKIASGGSPPPLHIVHEPEAAAYSWDEPISEMDYEELNDAEMLACKDEIKRRTAAGDCCLMHFVQAATDVFQFNLI